MNVHFPNVDRILETFNRHNVDYLLIGGMNFALRHSPAITYDVDLWIADTDVNRARCERALAELEAEWGASDEDWGPVGRRIAGWLARQGMYCLTSAAGAIDIFRSVKGLEAWEACRERAQMAATAGGISFASLADEDMLQCQMALPEGERKLERIRVLKRVMGQAEA